MDSERFNIAQYLPETAAKFPLQKAVICPGARINGRRSYLSVNFQQLNAECDRFAHGLFNSGLTRGMKTLLMVKPSIEFIALTFAVFKIGAIPVLIDPGMGIKRLLECIRNVEPDALIGIPQAHAARILFPACFKKTRLNVVVNSNLSFLGLPLEKISPECSESFPISDTTKASPAAILFTTGSTGPAKGVLYEHGMFDAQVQMLHDLYDFQPGEVDLAGLPVFALFDAALAMTCVVPDMDPSHPALVNPANIVEAIRDNGVTTSFGSPAIWNRVSEYCLDHNIVLPTLRRVLMAGAPVPGSLVEKFKKVIPLGDIHTPYGATESLPASSISGSKLISDTLEKSRQGFGTCVGMPAPNVEIRVIRISESPIQEWISSLILPPSEVGEIVIKGPQVTKEYYGNPAETELSKIRQGGEFWHRIGDVGYLDQQGRLWFCGRKSHRVELKDRILFTVPCEAIYNQHPNVSRTALVGIEIDGETCPVIVVEPKTGFFPEDRQAVKQFRRELFELGKKYEHTRNIKIFLFHKSFPVDIRHNAKIFREKLSVWARKKL
ncbi:MAG: fatty acid CoA ligase family protein [Candidatus Wallbacteria bacterium]|nr:fatty acid CoA ligase family protein [Candidatus Wallbacteria bacterium]